MLIANAASTLAGQLAMTQASLLTRNGYSPHNWARSRSESSASSTSSTCTPRARPWRSNRASSFNSSKSSLAYSRCRARTPSVPSNRAWASM